MPGGIRYICVVKSDMDSGSHQDIGPRAAPQPLAVDDPVQNCAGLIQ